MPDVGPEGGVIELERGLNFEQAVEDLIGFSHIWVLGHFNRSSNWKPKVQPPRGDRKVGCLASRSPHRPNPISLSVVPLIAIEGRRVWIGHHDLLDGTPILDIKPYIAAYDRLEGTTSGWTNTLEDTHYELKLSSAAQEQIDWLEAEGLPFLQWIRPTLSLLPKPTHNNRVIPQPSRGENAFQLAIKSWRVNFELDGSSVNILDVKSGYRLEVLRGEEDCPWGDVPLHIRFLKLFYD